MQDETTADQSETKPPEEDASVEAAESAPDADAAIVESEEPAVEEEAAAEPELSAEEIEARAAAWLHSGSGEGAESGPQARIVEPEPEPFVPPVVEAPVVADASEDADSDADDAFDEDLPEIIVQPPDDGVVRRWYAIHAHSGQEGNVQAALIVKAEQAGMSDSITNVFVPMEEVAEYKSGEKKISKRKFFPGYVLVQLPEHPEKNADLWHLIKDTPGVTGFIGSRTEPVPLEDSEVLGLVEEMRGERERPRPKLAFEIGERVKINDGAFANFLGNIGEINEDRGKMKVLIEIFERQTNVEVEFWQVEKI